MCGRNFALSSSAEYPKACCCLMTVQRLDDEPRAAAIADDAGGVVVIGFLFYLASRSLTDVRATA
jgi:hypothetical protein